MAPWHAGWHAWTGPWFFAGPLFGLIWIGLIALAAWLVLRYLHERNAPSRRAREILDERYARGELSSEEYRERADHLI
jgi:putative membrane protein